MTCSRCNQDMVFKIERHDDGLCEFYHCPICANVIWLNHTPEPISQGGFGARHIGTYARTDGKWIRRNDGKCRCGNEIEEGRVDRVCQECRSRYNSQRRIKKEVHHAG